MTCLQNILPRGAQTAAVESEVHIQTASKDQDKENLLQPGSTHSEPRWTSIEEQYVVSLSIAKTLPKGYLESRGFLNV